MHDLEQQSASARVGEECRRVAELLRLTAVGVIGEEGGRRHAAWWVAPGTPPLPSRLDDVLQGLVEGWITSPLPRGAVFARMTAGSSVHSPSALAALAPALHEALLGRIAELPAIEPGDAEGRERGRDLVLKEEDLPVLESVASAVRTVLETPGATVPDLLERARTALRTDELYMLRERGADISVAAAAPGDRPTRIPHEVSAGLDDLPQVEGVADATARQLGVVLGARTPLAGAAFHATDGRVEMILAGRTNDSAPSGAVMKLVGRMLAAGRSAIESRHRAVDALLLQERTRWAFEIHDGLIQAVTSAIFELQMLRRTVAADPALAAEGIATVESEIRRSLGALRGMLFDLSNEGDPAEADESLPDYVRRVARRWKLSVTTDIEGDVDRLSSPVRDAACMVVREGLANTAKHSASSRVGIRIAARPDGIRLEIEDEGRGFVPGTAEPGHLGLELMRRRVMEASGTLDIESSPGNGTRVVAWLPVGREGVRQ